MYLKAQRADQQTHTHTLGASSSLHLSPLTTFIKMSALLLLVLCSSLCCVYSDIYQDKIEVLMDNVLVLRVQYVEGSRVDVSLTCGEAFHNQPVFWKKDGLELQPRLQGNQVKVLVEEMDGGNYTCHLGPGGEYLNHTLILVQLDSDNRSVILEEMSPNKGHIHCSAPNYKGAFRCQWKRTQHRSKAVVLLVKAERHLEQVACVLNADGSAVDCVDVGCPFKEEQHHIYLTVYIRSYSRLEAYTKAFYLREIVKPDQLSNPQMSDGHVFTWGYPDSWETPRTYFALRFQVKVVSIGHSCNSEDQIQQQNITEETQFKVTANHKRFRFCVRAQDKYTNGPWNDWTNCVVNKNRMDCQVVE